MKMCDIKGRFRKTPCRSDISEVDESEELNDLGVTHYRSIVGKLMYIAGERPDAQFGIHCLAKSMKTPTLQSLKLLGWHKGLWSQAEVHQEGQKRFGQEDAKRGGGSGRPSPREDDADYAGHKADRKSVSCCLFFMDSNLIEPRVRSEKSIALSSGESELAIVGGRSESLFLRHISYFTG